MTFWKLMEYLWSWTTWECAASCTTCRDSERRTTPGVRAEVKVESSCSSPSVSVNASLSRSENTLIRQWTCLVWAPIINFHNYLCDFCYEWQNTSVVLFLFSPWKCCSSLGMWTLLVGIWWRVVSNAAAKWLYCRFNSPNCSETLLRPATLNRFQNKYEMVTKNTF